MFNRPLGQGIIDNPLIDSPFVEQYDIGLGAYPSVPLWLLLDTEHFKTLGGQDFAFLG